MSQNRISTLHESRRSRILRINEQGRESILKLALTRKMTSHLHNEYTTLCRLGYHPHIIQLLACEEMDKRPALRFPYFHDGTLEQQISAQGLPPTHRKLRILLHTALALQHAHLVGFLHLDVKPANIYHRRSRYLLADWGCALEIGATRTRVISDVKYAAPEVHRNSYGTAADIYSLGCLLHRLLLGKRPFGIKARLGRKEIIKRHQQAERVLPVGTLEPSLAKLMIRMLELQPERRPTLAQVIETLEAEISRAWRHETGSTLSR